MKTKAIKLPYIFVFTVLSLCVLSLCFFRMAPKKFSTEAVFSAGSQKKELDFAFYSALPFAASKKPAKTEETKNVPFSPAKETQFETYNAEPSIVSGILQIKNNTPYSPDIASLLKKPFDLKGKTPTVLILHTHTSEAYAQSEAYPYTPSDAYRTENTEKNICFVGEKLGETLKKNGISVIHDKTSHDYPSYSGCYARSLETAEKHLRENPAIDIIIDLHRDAISDENGHYLKTSAKIDGKDSAQAVIIVGTDAGGLPHPNWEENLSIGLKVQETICKLYPDLVRPLQVRSERFNGHACSGSLLIEIGTNANTMEEALYCAELVGDALSQTLLASAN